MLDEEINCNLYFVREIFYQREVTDFFVTPVVISLIARYLKLTFISVFVLFLVLLPIFLIFNYFCPESFLVKKISKIAAIIYLDIYFFRLVSGNMRTLHIVFIVFWFLVEFYFFNGNVQNLGKSFLFIILSFLFVLLKYSCLIGIVNFYVI